MNNTFRLGTKKYEYHLGQPFEKDGERVMNFSCPALEIDQDFLVEDIPELILDLPNIAHNVKESRKQEAVIQVRVKLPEKERIIKKAREQGYKSTSAYIRDLTLQ